MTTNDTMTADHEADRTMLEAAHTHIEDMVEEMERLRAQLAQVTAERDALRALAVDRVPRCGFDACDAPATHESPGVLRTEWACDEHHRTIEYPVETEHADVIRTLPRHR